MWPFKKKLIVADEIKKFTTAEVEAFHGGSAIFSDWSSRKAIQEGFKSSVWVYACVTKRADSIASVPLVVGREVDGDFEPIDNHPLQVLLNHPNPSMDMNSFLQKVVMDLDLAGNSYFGKIRGGRDGLPLELWPYQADYIQVVPGRRNLIDGYVHSFLGTHNIPFEDMCHLKYLDPASPYFGLSPMKAAGKSVDIDNAAHAWQKVSMQERGVPDGVFSLQGENVTTAHYEQALAEIKRNKSGPSNARTMWVMAHAKFQQMSLTAVEMDFMDSRRFCREEICSVYGVPSALIAEMGNVNLANSETARRVFWVDTLEPLLTKIENQLTLCLASEYGDDILIRFDTSGIPALQANLTEKLVNAGKLFALGVPVNTINEVLDLGLDDIEGGDVGYIGSGNVPSSFDFTDDDGGEDPPPVDD